MNSNSIACPLDCYDTCEAVFENDICKGSKEHKVTNGKLCINFANLQKESFLEKSFYENEEISLDESLTVLVKKLEETNPENSLYYKGAGNLGVMQNSPKTFFYKYGSVMTQGGLCEEPGFEGLSQGRDGKVKNPPIEKLIDSDVIIAWGRNFSVTSPHMYNLVKEKTFITIDPIKTPIAKKSELHMQINPKTDHELALLLTRFAYMEDAEDEEFISNHSGADWFFDLAKGRPVVSYEATTGVSLSDVTKFFEIIKDKKVSIVLGLGVQKYYEGAQIVRAIDSFAAYIGVHNKSAGGLWYIDDSSYGYENQFKVNPKKKIDYPSVDFSSYDLVFIQGANPVVSAPNTQRVIDGLKNSFVVYFGTTLNETAKYANLIIPSSNFLEKEDVRLSYGHQYQAKSYAVKKKSENTIREYELTQYLNGAFSFEKIKDEQEILDSYRNHTLDENLSFIDSFEFLEELEIDNLYEKKSEDEFYFITSKRKENLNSQFKSDNRIYLNPNSGFNENDEVKVSSENAEANFIVALSDDIKSNCALCFSGNKKANYLTSEKSDEEASSAIYQEVLISIELS